MNGTVVHEDRPAVLNRVLLKPESDPFLSSSDAPLVWKRGIWPASWIASPDCHEVVLYRCRFAWKGGTIRLHLSADQRYEAFLDGIRMGRGPERGDLGHWHFETYDATLEPGDHHLVVRVWSLVTPPYAQISLEHGLLCASEGAVPELLNTGVAPWECRPDRAWTSLDFGVAWGTGTKVRVTADQDYLDAASGGGKGWGPVKVASPGLVRPGGNPQGPRGVRQLQPAMLPAQLEKSGRFGRVVHVSTAELSDPVKAATHLADEGAAWQALLEKETELVLPPHTRRLVLIDLGHYRCAFPDVTAEGAGKIRMEWAEALFTDPKEDLKGNRSATEGLWFRGVGDEFCFTGPAGIATTLWFEIGRFVRLEVISGEEALVLRAITWREVGYPFSEQAAFICNDPAFNACQEAMIRALRCSSHETLTDGPYYEQIQYIGDTRLECLAIRSLTQDHRLADKAVESFAWSLSFPGQLSSRYPTWHEQNIPTFSLIWIGMLHDAWLYGDPDRMRRLLPAMRAIRENFRSHADASGCLEAIPGWNFMDWVPTWIDGEPPGVTAGDSSIVAWLYAYIFGLCAELEEWAGEPALAARDRELALRVAESCDVYWDEQRGLYRDSRNGGTFSEHAQVLALLSGMVPSGRISRLLDGLTHAPDLARTTVYFSHYLFEVAARFRRPELLGRRLGFWSELQERGFTTVPESPEPSRSDCHAWGSHPLFHRLASILGIRPSAPGFASVRIEPMPGDLAPVSGSWPHPLGDIVVAIEDGEIRVKVPDGLPAVLVMGGREFPVVGSIRMPWVQASRS
jgi:alpha-L-rhamnosidase